MAGYEYNPLLKLNLQKRSAVSPADIEHIEEEITTINGDLKNKVPKFFKSIEELEIGEIGEYQGETNETFVNGFFYKRGTGDYVFDYVASREDVFNLAITNTISEKFYAYWQNYENSNYIETPVIQSNSVNTISNIGVRAGDKTFNVFLMPADVVTINGISINDDYNIFYDPLSNIYNRGNLAPFAVSSDNKWYDIKFESGSIYVKIDKVWVLASGYGRGTPRFGWNIYRTNYQYGKCVDCFLLPLVGGDLLFAYNDDNIIDLTTIDQSVYAVYNNRIVGWTPKNDTSLQVYSYSRVLSPSSQRVDTQPSLDPTDFATADQGAKADTALQGITHGTDGNYVTSTIGAKDANNEQAVSVSLTLQPIATAGSGAKGVAEASDVKDYIGNNTATKAQGTAADTALQQVEHGTDGLYVTTTVTQKSSNKQTIYTALTLQDVETADDTHKGVAEASNVRKMFNIIAAQSEDYGVMWDTANPSPQCIRIGNMYNHQTLPVQSQMIGGVMADDGTFTPFDNQTDWTQATQARNGSDGQVMIKIPQHWCKLAQYGTIREVWISPVELPSYVEIPTRYCGAYEASIERSTGKLCSVNNATADYRGGDNTSAWDGTYRTLLNRPVTYLNQSEFLAAARLRAAGTSWNNLLYKICRDIYWLFVTEYATLDSQAEYNAALDANGFRQGGLGAGVTSWDGTSWDNFNSYNPFVPCGYLDEYGNQTAVKDFSLFNADSTLLKTFSVNSYRGIILPFGHTWKHTADVLTNVESGDGNSAVYLCDNPANYNSSSVANYNFICNQMRIDSYVKEMVLGDNADIFAIVGGGNSTSYYCDQQWCGSLPSSGSNLRCWLFGGSAGHGSQAGLACARSDRAPGLRHRHFGSRLCFVP